MHITVLNDLFEIKKDNTNVLPFLMVHLTRLELARIFIHMDLMITPLR